MGVLGLHEAVLRSDGGERRDAGRTEADMDRLAEAGCGLLEVTLSGPADFDPVRLRTAAERRRLGIFVSLASLPPGLDIVGQPQDALDFLERIFPACAETGSFGVGGVIYDAPGRVPGPVPGSGPMQKQADALSRFVERAAKLARGHGLKLGIAPASRFETRLLNRAADGRWLIERVGAENLFLHLDTFSMNIEEQDWATAFETAAPFLGFLNLSEANRGVPGRGLLDWDAVFKTLAAIGARCPLVWSGTALAELSPKRTDGWPDGRTAMRERAETADDLLESGVAFLQEKAAQAGVTLAS